jgi:hypothetical protein
MSQHRLEPFVVREDQAGIGLHLQGVSVQLIVFCFDRFKRLCTTRKPVNPGETI